MTEKTYKKNWQWIPALSQVQAFIQSARSAERLHLFGPMPVNPQDASEVKQDPVLFIDGGLKHKQDIVCNRPSLSLGDGDSTESGDVADIILPSDKDYTDLQAALGIVTSIPFNHPPILKAHGLWGGRLDHQLVVLSGLESILTSSLLRRCELIPPLDSGSGPAIGLPAGKYQCHLRGEFSLLALTPSTLQLTGACRYPLAQKTSVSALSGLTLSNVADGMIAWESSTPHWLFAGEHTQISEWP